MPPAPSPDAPGGGRAAEGLNAPNMYLRRGGFNRRAARAGGSASL